MSQTRLLKVLLSTIGCVVISSASWGCKSTYSGAVPKSGIVRTPSGWVDDWNLTIVPRSYGFAESPNGADNALVMVDTSADERADQKSWNVTARALFRYRLEDEGQWGPIKADYILIKK